MFKYYTKILYICAGKIRMSRIAAKQHKVT